MKKIFKVLALIITLLLFYHYCEQEEVPEKNYYEISMDPQYERKEVPSLIKEINFDYFRNLIIDLKNLDNNLYLKSIVIYYKKRKIGEIYINENLGITDLDNAGYIDVNNYKFKYSINDDLLDILGEKNEKYNISSGPYMENEFIFAPKKEKKSLIRKRRKPNQTLDIE